ncbi:MAG TPA: ATP-dependent metallopeptidase FtsH/Yme1/Tma family protein, partial [Gemmataceae bacterium]
MPANTPPPPPDPNSPTQQNTPPQPRRANPLVPGAWIALVVISVIVLIYFLKDTPKAIDYTKFKELVDAGEVKSLVLIGTERAKGELRDKDSELAKKFEFKNDKFEVNLPHTEDQTKMIDWMEKKDAEYLKTHPEAERLAISKQDEPSPLLGTLLLNLLFIGILVA